MIPQRTLKITIAMAPPILVEMLANGYNSLCSANGTKECKSKALPREFETRSFPNKAHSGDHEHT